VKPAVIDVLALRAYEGFINVAAKIKYTGLNCLYTTHPKNNIPGTRPEKFLIFSIPGQPLL